MSGRRILSPLRVAGVVAAGALAWTLAAGTDGAQWNSVRDIAGAQWNTVQPDGAQWNGVQPDGAQWN